MRRQPGAAGQCHRPDHDGAGGPAWRQTTFHPFSVTARLAKGGTVLEPKLSAGTVDTPRYGEVDGVNAWPCAAPTARSPCLR